MDGIYQGVRQREGETLRVKEWQTGRRRMRRRKRRRSSTRRDIERERGRH